ncbi:MAG: hypothetical protein ACI30V_05025 [Muribaculaceae bacterium]
MDSKEFFATLHFEENVFELVEDTKMEFLVYFRAPFTGAGEIVVPAGTKFAASQRMSDDAIYIHPVGPEKELLDRMNKQEAAHYPNLANKFNGYSFFITVDNLRTWKLKYHSGSSERLLEILRLIREHYNNRHRETQPVETQPVQEPNSVFKRILGKLKSFICQK